MLQSGWTSGVLLGPLIPTLVPVALFFLQRGNEELTDITREEWNTTYDYIIVGGGSAGSVLANRLSEDPTKTVLLLETGGSESLISEVPLNAASLQLSELDWQFETEPQKNACLGMEGHKSKWPRGKVFGGSSVLNYMLYIRGNKLDYDMWAKDLGLTDWSWRHVFPYFIKSENNTNPETLKNGYHGSGGYLTTGQPPHTSAIGKAFARSGKYLGYHEVDLNANVQTGFQVAQGTVRRGARCSTAKAFLNDIIDRPNLHILAFSFVTKILIDIPSKKAYGVQFDRRRGKNYKVFARKEVIVSAGPINSPKLLMLSGIGPKDDLEALNIPVIKDLPVGENLQDHIYPGGIHFTVNTTDTYVQSRVVSLTNLYEFFLYGTGPLTAMGGVEGLSFMKTRYMNQSADLPDFQIHLITGSPSSDARVTFKPTQGMTDVLYNTVFKPYESMDAFSLYPVLLHPKSKGYVKLRSADPYEKPRINPRYFSHPDDIKTVVDSMKISIAVGYSPVFRKFGAKLFTTRFPGCFKYVMWSDEYLECVARSYTVTIYHPIGTCRMGNLSDPRTVVDQNFKVLGIQNLRVVDTSTMPELISGNTNAPVIMMAERAADFIKEIPTYRLTRSQNVGYRVRPTADAINKLRKAQVGKTNFKIVDRVMRQVVEEHRSF